jgi:Domain of unknown function (DUF4062)
MNNSNANIFERQSVNKKYQVFVSSTYLDLIEERQSVIKALLNTGCIPSGMELFPATDTSQWEYIKKVIDECDYYVLVIAGRYGSIEKESGVSYTEKEYRYARDAGKPTICFYLDDASVANLPLEKTERELEQKLNLEKFKKFAREKLSVPYKNADQLAFNVVNSINNLKVSTPAIGWVRSDSIISGDSAEEILKLRREVENLEEKLSKSVNLGSLEIDLKKSVAIEYSVRIFDELEDNVPQKEYIINTFFSLEDILSELILYIQEGVSASKLKNALNDFIRSSEKAKSFVEEVQGRYYSISDIKEVDFKRLLTILTSLDIAMNIAGEYHISTFGDKILADKVKNEFLREGSNA